MPTSVTQEWLQMLSLYGWIWIIPMVERLLPLNHQPFLRSGIINDLIHSYHRIHSHTMINVAFVAWLVAYAQKHAGQGAYLQDALTNVHWVWSFIALLLIGHITFYVAYYYSHKIPLLWQFHRVHHGSLTMDSFSTSRFNIIVQHYQPLSISTISPRKTVPWLY